MMHLRVRADGVEHALANHPDARVSAEDLHARALDLRLVVALHLHERDADLHDGPQHVRPNGDPLAEIGVPSEIVQNARHGADPGEVAFKIRGLLDELVHQVRAPGYELSDVHLP
eukprot:1192361-Prorocentrum_minimum.AAC.10